MIYVSMAQFIMKIYTSTYIVMNLQGYGEHVQTSKNQHSNEVCILSHVRDNGLENYLGHDIDLLRLHDVINDIIIQSVVGHFLLRSG